MTGKISMHRVRLLIVIASGVLVTACSSTPTKTAMDSSPPVSKAPTAKAAPVASPAPRETAEQKMARVIKALSSKSVYFDYDDFSVKPQYQDLIKQDYDLLASSPTLAVTLQGNADERGSTEYNLALGQKRAESVKSTLKMLGIPEARLEAVSYGEEKLRATCHEEKCWAENRRVDVVSKKSDGSK